LDSSSHHPTHLLGDGAYNDAALQRYLAQYRSLELLAPAKVNQPSQRSQPAQRQLNRLRLICETVNAQLQEQLHLSKHYAKSTWGLMTRIAAKVTAHSVGMMVNSLLGRPAFQLADLAVYTTRTKRKCLTLLPDTNKHFINRGVRTLPTGKTVGKGWISASHKQKKRSTRPGVNLLL